MGKITVGIVGCGFIAKKRHIPAFPKIRNKARVVAVCDIDKNLAVSTAKQLGIGGVYTNLPEMICKEHLDVVDICTPPKTHKELAIQAMEKHCHVLMEKPMALKESDCEEDKSRAKIQTHALKRLNARNAHG